MEGPIESAPRDFENEEGDDEDQEGLQGGQENLQIMEAKATGKSPSPEMGQSEGKSYELVKENGEMQKIDGENSNRVHDLELDSMVDEVESEVVQSKFGPHSINVLQIENCAPESRAVKTAETKSKKEAVDLNIIVPLVEGDAPIERPLNKEEIAGELEVFLSKAVRELRSREEVWVLGLIREQEFEPLFYLMKGTDRCRSKLGSECLGPPPWFRGEKGGDVTDESRVRAWLGTSMADEKGLGKNLESEFDETGKKVAKANLLEPGLIWEKPPKPNQFVGEGISVYEFGLNIKLLGPLRWPNNSLNIGPHFLIICEPRGKQVRKDDSRLPRELLAPQTQRRSFEPPLPPTGRPPPQPPDFTPKLSRLKIISMISDFPATLHSLSLRINGKEDAAADHGDFQIHQFLFLASDSAHSLEGKTDFKGLARAVITLREGGSYVDGWSFDRPPVEPPPLSRSDVVFFLLVFGNTVDYNSCQLKGRRTEASGIDPGDYSSLLLRGDKHEDDQMLLILCHFPRPPEFVHNKEVPLNDRKRLSCLIKDNDLQAQVDKFQVSTKVGHKVDFKRIDEQLTHQGRCTLKILIKLRSFALALPTRCQRPCTTHPMSTQF